jgi:hypothetical protein
VSAARPVAEILEQAEREGWPTSSIDAMANHHLCGTPTQDYVNKWFTEEPRCPTPPQQS